MPAPRRTWAVFLAAVLALVAAMAALSAALLRHEGRRLADAAAADHAARLRASAAAMDRWLGPVLAREAGRHHADYAPYRPTRRAFSSDLERLPAGSVLEPSPLLGHEAGTILLHVEWCEATGARSPQVPRGRERELALASGLAPGSLRNAEERLDALVADVDLAALARWVRERAPAPRLEAPLLAAEAACLSHDALAEGPLAPGLLERSGEAGVGPLLPYWLGGGRLALVRDVHAGGLDALQLVLVDWPALSRILLEESARDLPGARLVADGGGRAEGVALATVPVTLVADAPAVAAAGAWTPLARRLAVVWLAGLVSVGAIAWSLRASLAHAERRARFAAAVSHELRTPLTTLRLYSEMLAEGVITDPAVRQEYLETLQAESARLAALVENVLLHARVEQSPARALRRMTVGELVESVVPVLRRRADEAGRPLVTSIGLDPAAEVEVDRQAVERVLFNLVDNACKHGAGAEDATLTLDVRRRGRLVDLQLSDQGPGIPRALGAAVFEAFRRGEENGAPGVGLGLALSRSLARELRGELSLVPTDRGACFRLSLKLA